MKKTELQKLIKKVIKEQIIGVDPNTVSPVPYPGGNFIKQQKRKDCCHVAQKAFDAIENVINDTPGIQEMMPPQFFMYIQDAKQQYLRTINC